ncbi:hypothetical protein E0F55_08300 [Streptococcus pyogenes]|uniref:Transposase n=1 Tax=Streptococcus pyogenes TaxID=1314 RepID=A0A660A5F8_STRPY|nr:hypothetical protein D1F63_00240 [Streptococcus pyogenes]AZA34401.1 hypothetical protein EHF39_00240 [Streptococcus pyogenes]AZA36196.1 hypothetical protein EHF40_00240 [Streptococcus pyogenes]MWP74371.1 hypothetical protein [Streptococcus pyogenes]TNY47167.1 hypothetical protein FGO82_05405 [Streptococcus pyogenes]
MFQTIFKIFLKEKNKISNILKLNYSKAKLETVNNLIKAIKLNVLLLLVIEIMNDLNILFSWF